MGYINNNVDSLSTSTPLLASETWTSDTASILQYSSLLVTLISDEIGVFYFDSSGDGQNFDLSESTAYTTPGVAMHLSLDIRSKHIRFRYVNDLTDQTYFRLITYTNYFRSPSSGVSNSMVVSSSSVATAAGVTVYYSNSGFTSSFSGGLIEAQDIMVITEPCRIRKFAARIDLVSGGTANCTYWIRKNFARTAHTITFTSNSPEYKEIIIDEPMLPGDVWLFECVVNAGGAQIYPKSSASLEIG